MFIFSSALLGNLGGGEQGFRVLAHFKYVRSHPCAMAQSGKVRNQEIKKGLGETLLSSFLDVLQRHLPQIPGKARSFSPTYWVRWV